MFKVAVFVGSPRPVSTNLKLAKALETLANGKLSFDYVDIASLPFYDDSLWNDPPATVITHGTLVPLRVAVHVVGRGIPVAVASEKPKVVDAPAASAPFHDALLAVSLPPVTEPFAFHMDPACPVQGKDTDHEVAAPDRPFLTATSTVRPASISITGKTFSARVM